MDVMFARAAIRHAALAVLLPLLVLSAGSARALYRCAYDNVTRAECCCPTSARAPRSLAPSVSRACCCDIERPKAAAAQAQLRPERSETPQFRLAASGAPALPRLALRAAGAALQRPKVGLD